MKVFFYGGDKIDYENVKVFFFPFHLTIFSKFTLSMNMLMTKIDFLEYKRI